MSHGFFNHQQLQRSIDVTTIENALVDMLIKGSNEDVSALGMTKGIMQLVDTDTQNAVFSRMSHLRPEIELGGSAANAVRGMATLGARVCYSSAVADDTHGRNFSKRLDELHIVNRLAKLPGTTGTCLVVVTPDGERTLNTHLGVCRDYTPACVPMAEIAQSKMFFTTGYVWDTPNQIAAIQQALEHSQKNDVKIAFDIADPFVVARSGEAISKLFPIMNLLFANAEEARMLTGHTGEAAARMLGEKIEIAVVKDGSQGAYIAHRGNIIHVPALSVDVVDTTGAGDMFAGGFMYGLVKGLPLQQCGELATIMAGDTITYMGVRLSHNLHEKVHHLKLLAKH